MPLFRCSIDSRYPFMLMITKDKFENNPASPGDRGLIGIEDFELKLMLIYEMLE